MGEESPVHEETSAVRPRDFRPPARRLQLTRDARLGPVFLEPARRHALLQDRLGPRWPHPLRATARRLVVEATSHEAHRPERTAA